MKGQQEKNTLFRDIKMLLEKYCEVEKIIKFLKEIQIFEEI